MQGLKECISNQISIDKDSMDHILSVFEPKKVSKGVSSNGIY